MQAESGHPDSHFQVLAAILGLAPALIGTALKWLQDNSRSKRRSELSDRLVAMSKLYSDHNPGTDEVLGAAHVALGNEIHGICKELGSLQVESKRSSRRTFYGWLSDLLLLYRPRGVLAWTVHLLFYAGITVFLLFLLGELSSFERNDLAGTLVGVFVFGLLLLGLQRLASKLHGHA